MIKDNTLPSLVLIFGLYNVFEFYIFLFPRKELQLVFHQTVYHGVFTVFVQSWVV